MNPFVIEQSAEELALTSEFHRNAWLSAIRLKSFSARGADTEPDIKEGFQLEMKHEARRGRVGGDDVCFEMSMTMEAFGDGDRNKLVFHVACVFELSLGLRPDFKPSDAQLAAFERGNTVFLCWPYVREFVQSATQRLGLSVPPVPLLRTVLKEAGGDAAAPKPAKKRKRHTAS